MKPNMRLLSKMADFLSALPPEKPFDFNVVVSDSQWKGAQDLSCGAAACAIGYMPLMPFLAKYRLGYSKVACTYNKYGKSTGYKRVPFGFCGYTDGVNVVQKGRRYATRDGGRPSFQTAKTVFRLTNDEAQYLFVPWRSCDKRPQGPDETATAKDVAEHIRAFVARGGMPDA